MTDSADTIYAVATAPGRSGVAIVRVSGDGAGTALSRCLSGTVPRPRFAARRAIVHPLTGELIDDGLVLWMPAPASFTGEDVAEFHLHGGLAVRRAIVAALACLPSLRPAEAGEFTRRAFVNGRMDLSEVEGLADLIDAETEAQRRQAVRQMTGGLRTEVEVWRDRLIDASALVEASLDFTDEEDVPDDLVGQAGKIIHEISIAMQKALSHASRGERLREGFQVVLTGPPNVGKSTLLNCIARREVAIVSPVAGTTRDAIEVRCDLDGLPVTFVDTAGLRSTSDIVELAGIDRTLARARTADLVLRLQTSDTGAPDQERCGFTFGRIPEFVIHTKADQARPGRVGPEDSVVSAQTGEGVDALVMRVRDWAAGKVGTVDAVLTRERQRVAVAQACEALERASAASQPEHAVLVAEDMRLALRALGRISGRVDVDDVLDRIFGRFCIGK